MTTETHTQGTPADGVNRALVLEAFDQLFNRHDYTGAEALWSENYISAQRAYRARPRGTVQASQVTAVAALRNQFSVAEGDLVMLYGRFSGINPEAMVTVNVVRVEDCRLAEHWDVRDKEPTRAESVSGLPMFGDAFPDER